MRLPHFHQQRVQWPRLQTDFGIGAQGSASLEDKEPFGDKSFPSPISLSKFKNLARSPYLDHDWGLPKGRDKDSCRVRSLIKACTLVLPLGAGADLWYQNIPWLQEKGAIHLFKIVDQVVKLVFPVLSEESE